MSSSRVEHRKIAGEYYINMVYTYRSCSKALPQVKNQDDQNKDAIYETHCV